MARVKVFLPYPPSNKSLFQLWPSPSRTLPNSRQTSLYSNLSYSSPLSTKQGLLLQIPWALQGLLKAKRIPCLVFSPRSLNSRPFECHYRFMRSLQLLCLTSWSQLVLPPLFHTSWRRESSSVWFGRPIKCSTIPWPNFLSPFQPFLQTIHYCLIRCFCLSIALGISWWRIPVNYS